MMRISSIAVKNFKSLVDFKLDLAKFNCLIGLNGSGKSTVLQVIDFLSQLMQGDITAWLRERKWKANELTSRLTGEKIIEFAAVLSRPSEMAASWQGRFNTTLKRCTYELLSVGDFTLQVEEGRCRILHKYESGDRETILNTKVSFTYEGSILSQLREEILPEPLIETKRFFQQVESLDLLSPELLRQRTRESVGSLGLGGERLSAFLHELGPEKRQQLASQLKEVYPKLQGLHVRSLRSGWKQLEILEAYPGKTTSGLLPRMTTESRHVNDGMLRLIAIMAQLQTEHRFLLFDEIENGINPELIEFLLDALVLCEQQVLVTTHSPMILNYLGDTVARFGVHYLYKTSAGRTQAIRFFEIPSLAEKLRVMGPGEVFADTDLNALSEEIEQIARPQ